MQGLIDWLRRWYDETPDAPAWWVEEAGQLRCLNWREVGDMTVQLAASLPDAPGERILSRLPNGIEWAALDLACQVRGLVHVPIDGRIRDCAMQAYKSLVRPIAFFASLSLAELREKRPSGVAGTLEVSSRRDELLCGTVLFTSGTNGRPRGVMLSHRNLLHNAMAKLEAVPQTNADRRLNILPFAHAYARTCELSTWLLSGSSMLCVSSYEEMLRLAPLYKPTLINAVPYVFEKLKHSLTRSCLRGNEPEAQADSAANSDRSGDSGIGRSASASGSGIDGRSRSSQRRYMENLLGGELRVLAAGGAGLSKDVFEFFAELGLPIIQGYGLTEASPVVCSNRVDNPQADCVGPPVRDTEIRIDDDQRLFVKGPGVMLGYWENEPATCDKIVDGWLDTGDRAERLANGSIRILGRCDDRIVLSTGDKLDPWPIESRLCRLDSIRQAVLVGHGRKFVAAIVVSKSQDEAGLLEAIQRELNDLPSYACPKRLIIVEEEWSASSGLLNHKGAVIRRAVLERYQLEIGRLYHPSLGRRQEALNPRQAHQQTGGSDHQRDDVQQ